MKRRKFLVTAVFAALAGCFSSSRDESPTSSDDPSPTPSPEPSPTPTATEIPLEERVPECEEAYLKAEVETDEDEELDDMNDPIVLDVESRDDGHYVTVKTIFATRESTEGEPDLIRDKEITAYYLVTPDGIYRTEDEAADPRDGEAVDC